MTSHSRLSPGIEINEIDRSGYQQKTDYSIVNTTVFMCGFADKGENYTPQWVNTMATFESLYGEPKNEVEMYLRTGVKEVLDKGGVCVVSKLPYDNLSKDRFAVARYKVCQAALSGDDPYVRAVRAIDGSVTACLSVQFEEFESSTSGLIDLSALDGYRTGTRPMSRNEIVVVDVTRGKYGDVDLISSGNSYKNVECLGIVPVVTTPVNAMFYQGVLSSSTVTSGGEESTAGIADYQPVADVVTRSGERTSAYSSQNFSTQVSARTIYDDCLAKRAAEQFPDITFNLSSTLDRSYLKKIGLVVFKAVRDQANDNKVEFQMVESFVGSLDKTSRDPETGANDYIGDVVNSGSEYVNFFSNVAIDQRYKDSQTIVTASQPAASLGFYESETAKHMSYSGSFVDPLNRALDMACDPNQVRIDVVCEAGVATLAAFAAQTEDRDRSNAGSAADKYNAEAYPRIFSESDGQTQGWGFDSAMEYLNKWRAVLAKFDSFCKVTRKDCMFVADMLRPVVLEGEEKLVRNTSPENTIEKALLPRLKYVAGLNSSWSAGYSNWFYAQYGDTSDFFWCPPSIKAVGAYVYSDAYYHTWDAPAGLIRGVVSNVYDVSFNPRNDEAGRIYQQAWNYAVSYPVHGIVLEGQKTFQLNRTALDRVNVRRLLIWLEKSVTAVARRFLYEGNTAYMRQLFVDTIRPIFEQAKSGYGISDYAIRCDETLNTDDVIDNNELRCVIGIKPIKTIEWIVINLITTSQSASVNEEVMK